MLVTFSTESYPSITMFGDDALAMLKMMGHSATVPGSIRAEDVSHALDLLTSSMTADKALPKVAANNDEEPAVSMAHRGMPLVELLTAAVKANDYVMWNESTFIK